MNEQEEKKQQQTSEFDRDKERAGAAAIGAVVGGSAFAAAAYSAGVWDEGSHPEVVSIETQNQATTDLNANTEESPIPTEDDAVSIVSVENNEMVVEEFEYPHEGAMLQSDIHEVMDVSIEPIADISSMDHLDCIAPDSGIMTDDSQLHLI